MIPQKAVLFPLLSPEGAKVIIGGLGDSIIPTPITPSRNSLFGPRGICLVADRSLWVADTGHHRLLGWRSHPESDNQPADWIIGQPDFFSEGKNAKGNPTGSTLSVPTGICTCGEGLAVADAWNHRILIWKQIPEDSNVPADIVLGQADFSQGEPNRGFMDTACDRLQML